MKAKVVYVVLSNNEKILNRWFLKSPIDKKDVKIIQFSKDKPAVAQLNKLVDEAKNDNNWLVISEESIKLSESPAAILEGKKPETVYGVTGAGKVTGDKQDLETFDGRNGEAALADKPVESLSQGVLIVHSSLFKKKNLRFDEKFPDYYMVDFSVQCRKSGLNIALLPFHCEFRSPALPSGTILRGQRALREKYPNMLPIGTWDGPVTMSPGKDFRAHSKLKDKRINDFIIKTERLAAVKKSIEPLKQEISKPTGSQYDELEKKLVWIFGGPRSGTTWLATGILDRKDVGLLNEPLIGSHIGLLRQDIMLYYQIANGREDPVFERSIDINKDNDNRFFAEKYEKVWLNSLRSMILDRIAAQFDPKKYHCIVIKAPNESHAADIIMAALPNSKLIFLIRDGRDVIDSRSGAFHNPTVKKRPNTPEERKYRIVYFSTLWNLHSNITSDAYDAHSPDLKLFLKYEDLRFDTVRQINKIYRFLGIKASDDEIKRIAEETKFENIPEEERGEDKNTRKATPGAWRESFNKEETALMNKIMGNNLVKFGYKL